MPNTRLLSNPNRTAHFSYYAKCAFDYFVSLTVTGAILTRLLLVLGVSDALIGILSSIAQLAGSIQFLSPIFLRRQPSIRNTAIYITSIQHSANMCMFLLPFLPVSPTLRIVLFVALYLVPTIFKNLVGPGLENTYMYYIDPLKRGVFSNTNCAVSSITSIFYTYAITWVVDYFDQAGNVKMGFLMCSAAILVCCVGYAFSVLKVKDAPPILENIRKAPPLWQTLKSALQDKNFDELLLLPILWNLCYHVSYAYFAVNLMQEAGKSMTYVTLTTIVFSLACFVFYIPAGKFADRFGHITCLTTGFGLVGLTSLLLVFWTPQNAATLYMISRIPQALGSCCISASVNNILYNYTPQKNWVSAYGIYASFANVAGFVGALLGGGILSAVQSAGNRVFGIPAYAQGVLCLLTLVGMVVLCIYLHVVIKKLKKSF